MAESAEECTQVDSESEVAGVPSIPRYLFRQRRRLTDKAMSGIPGSSIRAAFESDTCTASEDEGEQDQQ